MSEIKTQQTRKKGEYQGSPYFSELQMKHLTTIYSNIQTAALQTKRRRQKTAYQNKIRSFISLLFDIVRSFRYKTGIARMY